MRAQNKPFKQNNSNCVINCNCNGKRRTLSHHAALLHDPAVRISEYAIVASHVAAQVVLMRPAVVHAIPHGGRGALRDVTRSVLTGAAAAFRGILVAASALFASCHEEEENHTRNHGHEIVKSFNTFETKVNSRQTTYLESLCGTPSRSRRTDLRIRHCCIPRRRAGCPCASSGCACHTTRWPWRPSGCDTFRAHGRSGGLSGHSGCGRENG
jgi:hypothetical protein